MIVTTTEMLDFDDQDDGQLDELSHVRHFDA
jgi:hypothetical protein